MTRDDILNMPAGREMNRLVMEWVTELTVDDNFYIPAYSTDIAAAWEVVEKLMHDGFIWKSNGNESCGNLIYSFSFAKDDGGYEEYFQTFDSGITENNLPLAICRAALLAVMGGGQ